MKKSTIAINSFLAGFAQDGLFGWSKLPGGAEMFCEETTNLEESQFAELLMPFVKKSQVPPSAD
jgi:hypothetical protein